MSSDSQSPSLRLARTAHGVIVMFVVLGLVGVAQVATPDASAQLAATTTDNVNLRSGPGTSFEVVRIVPRGATVSITGSAENGYVPITYSGSSGYVSGDYLSTNGGGSTAGPTGTWYVFDGTLNLRSGPGTTYGIITQMQDGAAVQLTGEIANGFSKLTWNGTTGWAATQYLTSTGPAPSTPTPIPVTLTPKPVTPAPTSVLPTATPGGNVAIGDTAIGTAMVSTGGASLYMRSGPGPSYSVVRSMPNGATVEVMGADQNGYRPVRYQGSKGWASAAYLRASPTSTPTPTKTPTQTPTPVPTQPATAVSTATKTPVPATSTTTTPGGIGDTVISRATVTAGGSSLNMRTGPDTTYSVIRSIPDGASVDVMGSPVNGFLPVRYLGTKGWSSASYLRVTPLPVTPTPTATKTATPVPTATNTSTPVPTATQPPTATATTPSTATPPPPGGIGDTVVTSAVVNAGGMNLNMRTGPGTTYSVIRSIPDGASVDVMGTESNGFLPVRYLGTKGWSSATFLDVGPAPTATAPVTATPTSTPGTKTPTPTATATPAGTKTPTPTATLSPTPSPSPTPIPNVPVPAGPVLTTAVVSTSGSLLMARSGPGLEYPSIRGLPNGIQIDVLGEARNGWRPVRYAGTLGWVDARYLVIGATQSTDVPLIDDTADHRVTLNVATSLRSGPASTYASLISMPSDMKLETLGPEYNGWTPIRYYGYKGWVPNSVLTPGWGVIVVDQLVNTVSQPLTTEPGAGSTVIRVAPGTLVDITGPAQGNYIPAMWSGKPGWLDTRLLVRPEAFVDPGERTTAEQQMIDIVYAAADRWGQSRTDMLRVARCESNLNPLAINPYGLASGLFQFMPSTFALTPNGKAGENIFNPWSNADAAGWAWANGMRNHWQCQ